MDNKNLKIISWNKGVSSLLNKIEDIKIMLKTENCQIMSLNEANFSHNENQADIEIENYNCEWDNLRTIKKHQGQWYTLNKV